MKKFIPLFLTLCGLTAAATGANAQFYKLHGADIGGGGIGQFTRHLNAGNDSVVADDPTDSFGGIFSLRDHPVSWAGIEFNYSYAQYHQYYRGYASGLGVVYDVPIKTQAHEATAAYLFQPKAHWLHPLRVEPFLALGGGYIDFVPASPNVNGSNQWRETGLAELGFDIPTSNRHMGFRVQGRELLYRQANFNKPYLASRKWVGTSEPMFGVWYRW